MVDTTLIGAVTMALTRAMAEDERVVVLGEDVGVNGGVFRATEGLIDRFGPERVIDTPLAELAIGGVAVGMAATGRRDPVHGLHLPDHRSDGEPRCPPSQPDPRPPRMPDGAESALRRRHPRAGAPFRKHRGDVRAHAGAACGDPVLA